MAQAILYLYTESPLHAGAGSGLGTVDLPIQRERHTDLPLVQGSGIKGALRARAQDCMRDTDRRLQALRSIFGPDMTRTGAEDGERVLQAVFGPETERASEYAGALTVGDARLLLFPVRSLRGVFAWVTSPLVIRRLQRDLRLLSVASPTWEVPQLPDDPGRDSAQALVTPGSAVTLEDNLAIVLEEYTFRAQPDQQIGAFAQWLGAQLPDLDPWWIERLSSHLVVLPDSAFRDFVLYATEVVTRVRIDHRTKTVEEGGLWTEESLPTDSLLYSPLLARTPAQPGAAMTDSAALAFVRSAVSGVFPLGGDETVGRGLVRALWAG